jgi:septal ring factor EnvC (AmiA/AmiB activator)
VSQLHLVQEELQRVKEQMADEQHRSAKLRAELASINEGHVKVLACDCTD